MLRELVSMVPWEFAFEGAGIHQHRSLLKYYLIRVQEKRTPKCQKSNRQDRMPGWLSKDLLLEF